MLSILIYQSRNVIKENPIIKIGFSLERFGEINYF